MASGKTITFAEFQNKDLTFRNLTQHLIKNSIMYRSLSEKPRYYPAMKRLLLDGPIRQYYDKDKDLFFVASKSGLVELTHTSYYDFPSPLHRQMWSWILIPQGQYNYTGDLFSLIKDTVAGFRPKQLSRSDRGAETAQRNPPEAQYSHEWYRSLHIVTGGNAALSPEFATAPGERRGRVDFMIPAMKWGIEIIRDGSRLREYSDRFITGVYRPLIESGEIVDYALLDFRLTTPSTPTPGLNILNLHLSSLIAYTDIPKLFYIVFSEENDHVKIYDNCLTCRWETNLVQNRLPE